MQEAAENIGSSVEYVPESISLAALMYRGEVFSGASHKDIALKLKRKYSDASKISVEELEDGFLTSTGRFVSREEATEIAKACGQIPMDHKEPLDSGDIPLED